MSQNLSDTTLAGGRLALFPGPGHLWRGLTQGMTLNPTALDQHGARTGGETDIVAQDHGRRLVDRGGRDAFEILVKPAHLLVRGRDRGEPDFLGNTQAHFQQPFMGLGRGADHDFRSVLLEPLLEGLGTPALRDAGRLRGRVVFVDVIADESVLVVNGTNRENIVVFFSQGGDDDMVYRLSPEGARICSTLATKARLRLAISN